MTQESTSGADQWYAAACSPDGWLVVLMGFGPISASAWEQVRRNCVLRYIDPAKLTFLSEDELERRLPGVLDNHCRVLESGARRHIKEILEQIVAGGEVGGEPEID